MTQAEELSKRDQRRALQQQLSRNQILDAAEEVFASKGFHEATIKEIAQLAEFSVGAVYGFFENKDDLFVQIYLRRGAEFMDGMRALMAEPRPPLDQMHDLADYQIDFFRLHPSFGRLYLRSSAVVLGNVESLIDQVVADRYDEAMAHQRDLFAAGQATGVFRPGDPAVVAKLFSALVSAFQSCDPVVMAGGADSDATMTVDEFHHFLDGAFGA